jgi:hypothetical protein
MTTPEEVSPNFIFQTASLLIDRQGLSKIEFGFKSSPTRTRRRVTTYPNMWLQIAKDALQDTLRLA